MDDAAEVRRIVYVLGPGRSGTSTMAGALTMSGLEVPGRVIGRNDTNPSGFYEPRWVVDLHKRLLDRAVVATLDTDPDAYDQVQETLGPQQRKVLREWLQERLAEQPRLVVKDPRGIWFKDLWSDVAAELDVPIAFLTMLRHPAEVSGSREKYYSKAPPGERPVDDVTRIGGWVNVALTAERITRDSPRVFVRYTDLLTDWRPVVSRVQDRLGLVLDPSPEVRPHPVDEFIDPALRRVRVDWDDLSLPEELYRLGERTWRTLADLADPDHDPADPTHRAEADGLREAFALMSEQALALNRHVIKRVEAKARRKGRVQGRREARDELQAGQGVEKAPTSTPDQAPRIGQPTRRGKQLLRRLARR